MNTLLRRLKAIVRNSSSLLHGLNIYVNPEKLRLIDEAFLRLRPIPRSFADLGGMWKVNAGYAIHTLQKHDIEQGILVDTDSPSLGLASRLRKWPNLRTIQGDFASQAVRDSIGSVDCVYLFDVLLHQANPHWYEILQQYAPICRCFVVFNQQYVCSNQSVRLTDLPLEEYLKIAPQGARRLETYRYVYSHADEIHPRFGKPWKDIHNIFQWGITDGDLRSRMRDLRFSEIYFKNHGRFSGSLVFENHSFIFVKQ